MLTDYLFFILQALAVLAVTAVALLFIHFLFCIIAGGEDDFDAATSQTETPTAPRAAEGGRLMAGIYIPGMQFPKDCKSCDMFINCDACEGLKCYCAVLGETGLYEDDFPDGFRLQKCPLIPVPDHGRLIDADALLEWANADLRFGDPDFHAGLWHTISAIEDAPTIIPASEEGE